MNKVFCPECSQEVTYHIINETINEYKGYNVDVEQNIAVCDNCNEKIYVSELENDNLKRLYERYRAMSGIVTPEDIINFREKYNISQRELVAILDWGKMTINRYERGSLANQSHSDILKLIIKDENYFKEKVEDAYKNNRISEKTYTNLQSCVTSVEDNKEKEFIISRLNHEPSIYNGFKRFDLEKVQNLIGYIADEVDNLYKTSVNKYLWYIDFFNYKQNLKSITGLRYEKYTYGPIIENKNYDLILHEEDKFEKIIEENNYSETTKIKSKNNYNLNIFSTSEIEVINKVINILSDKSCSKISDLSHEESGWLNTNNGELISYEYAHDLKLYI